DEVEWMMRIESRKQEYQSVAIRRGLVVANRRPAVETFLDDPVVVPALRLKHSSPALGSRKAHRSLRAVGRHAAPCIRVAVTENLTRHGEWCVYSPYAIEVKSV